MIVTGSSVVVATLLNWHEFHDCAAQALENAIARGRLLIPLPVLVESYSVMARLPSPHRLRSKSPTIFCTSFIDARIVGPRSKGGDFPRGLCSVVYGGGRVHDAVIAWAALEARARELLTFNPRDFERSANASPSSFREERKRAKAA